MICGRFFRTPRREQAPGQKRRETGSHCRAICQTGEKRRLVVARSGGEVGGVLYDVFLEDLLIFKSERRKGFASAAINEMNIRSGEQGVSEKRPAGSPHARSGKDPRPRRDLEQARSLDR